MANWALTVICSCKMLRRNNPSIAQGYVFIVYGDDIFLCGPVFPGSAHYNAINDNESDGNDPSGLYNLHYP